MSPRTSDTSATAKHVTRDSALFLEERNIVDEVGREIMWADQRLESEQLTPVNAKRGSARFGEADVSECEDFARGIDVLAAGLAATASNDKSTVLYSPEWL